MSKTIKLEDRVYDKLTGLMRPKETYSQVVERVLTLFDRMGELRDILQASTLDKRLTAFELKSTIQKDVIGTDLQGKPLIERRGEP